MVGEDESLISFVEDRPGHDLRYGLVDERLRTLGWKPEVDFDNGLARTISWYREHQDWVDAMREAARS